VCFSFLCLPDTSFLSIPMIILAISMLQIGLVVNSGKEILANKKIMFHLFGRETDWTGLLERISYPTHISKSTCL
jgi:hypothetical protein